MLELDGGAGRLAVAVAVDLVAFVAGPDGILRALRDPLGRRAQRRELVLAEDARADEESVLVPGPALVAARAPAPAVARPARSIAGQCRRAPAPRKVRSNRILRNFYRQMAALTSMRCLGFASGSERALGERARWHRQSRCTRIADRVLTDAEGWWGRQQLLPRSVYWGIHAACLLGFWFTPTRGDLLLLATTFFVRMFAITGGYHRYFAHKTYKTSRAFQLVLAVLGATATQKGVLWWAGHHRIHHKYADQPGRDVHSPKDGFWYSHQGWIFDGRWDGIVARPDPGLRALSRSWCG